MNSFINLITAFIIALWLGLVAVFSIQNITEISVKFLLFESIKLPVGVLLSFCVGMGFILGALIPLFFTTALSKKKKKYFIE